MVFGAVSLGSTMSSTNKLRVKLRQLEMMVL